MTSRPALPNVEDIFPLTVMQQGMLFQSVQRPGNPANHEQFTLLLRGPLDAGHFQDAWQAVVDRHGALRAQFVWESVDKPLQALRRRVTIPWRTLDWSGASPAEQDARLAALLLEDRKCTFDPSKPPLLRLALVRLGEGLHRLVFSFNHILVDGWSVSVMLNELMEIYEARRAGRDPSLAPAPRYRDHIAGLARRDASRTEAYWRGLLAGFDARTEVPAVRPEADSAGRPSSLQTAAFMIDGDAFERVKAFTRASRLTMSTLVQGAWGLVLSRYCGHGDVVFGTTVSGRPVDLPGVENTVGMFINALPFRASIPVGATVGTYLTAIQAQARETSKFDGASAAELQRWSDQAAHLALYDSVVILGNHPLDEGRRGRAAEVTLESPRSYGWTSIPLAFMVTPGRHLEVEARYDSATVDPQRLAPLLGHFRNLIVNLAKDAGAALDSVPMLSSAERDRVVVACNRTARAWEGPGTIHGLFEEQAARTPASVAFRFQGRTISYSELNSRANRLAHSLIAAGVGLDVPVGVCVSSSLDLPVALLGILKAGGCYVPLDPSYPRERLDLIAGDARPAVIVTTHEIAATTAPRTAPHLLIDDVRSGGASSNPGVAVGPDHVAYVIYTSGSTGRPKGVEGTHRGAVNRFRWMWDLRPFKAGEVACLVTTVNFVDSVWEAFGGLLRGIPTEILARETVRDPRALLSAIQGAKVTRLVLVPTLLEAMLDVEPDLRRRLPDLRECVSSGEALPVTLARRFLAAMPGVDLLNVYGSSEVAADATFHIVTPEDVRRDYIPIGRPIANVQVLLLDERMTPVPPGVPGFIHVGGACLARGYRARPDLTAERFVPSPFGELPTERLFKTGDRARMLESGALEFLGRADHQVKIRGSRVELGEVEQVARDHPGVADVAVVTSGEDGDRQLVAYVVSNNGVLDGREVRQFLRGRLPDFMVPASVVPMPRLPRTPNGKLDRRALPKPEAPSAVAADAPMSEAEAKLAGLFREVLGLSSVGPHDSFFDLGGHSLLAVKLAAKIERAFGTRLPLATFLGAPTVAALAETITRGGQDAHRAPVVKVRTTGGRTPFFCIHGMDGNVLYLERLARGLSPEQPVYGIQSRGMDGVGSPETSFDSMADLYLKAIQEVQPAGPYVLGGYSLGGMLAVAVAHRLIARGETVSRIVLFDTRIPQVVAAQRLHKPWSKRFAYHIKRGPRGFLKSLYFGPIERGTWQLLTALNLPVPLRLRVWPVRQANLRAFVSHRPKPWAGPVSLLRADVQEDEFRDLPALGWEDFAIGELEVCPLPCEHLDFFASKSVGFVSAELERILAGCAQVTSPVREAALV